MTLHPLQSSSQGVGPRQMPILQPARQGLAHRLPSQLFLTLLACHFLLPSCNTSCSRGGCTCPGSTALPPPPEAGGKGLPAAGTVLLAGAGSAVGTGAARALRTAQPGGSQQPPAGPRHSRTPGWAGQRRAQEPWASAPAAGPPREGWRLQVCPGAARPGFTQCWAAASLPASTGRRLSTELTCTHESQLLAEGTGPSPGISGGPRGDGARLLLSSTALCQVGMHSSCWIQMALGSWQPRPEPRAPTSSQGPAQAYGDHHSALTWAGPTSPAQLRERLHGPQALAAACTSAAWPGDRARLLHAAQGLCPVAGPASTLAIPPHRPTAPDRTAPSPRSARDGPSLGTATWLAPTSACPARPPSPWARGRALSLHPLSGEQPASAAGIMGCAAMATGG